MGGVLGVLDVLKDRYITCIIDKCEIHMFYTCNTCVAFTPVLHMYCYM